MSLLSGSLSLSVSCLPSFSPWPRQRNTDGSAAVIRERASASLIFAWAPFRYLIAPRYWLTFTHSIPAAAGAETDMRWAGGVSQSAGCNEISRWVCQLIWAPGHFPHVCEVPQTSLCIAFIFSLYYLCDSEHNFFLIGFFVTFPNWKTVECTT